MCKECSRTDSETKLVYVSPSAWVPATGDWRLTTDDWRLASDWDGWNAVKGALTRSFEFFFSINLPLVTFQALSTHYPNVASPYPITIPFALPQRPPLPFLLIPSSLSANVFTGGHSQSPTGPAVHRSKRCQETKARRNQALLRRMQKVCPLRLSSLPPAVALTSFSLSRCSPD